MIQIGESIIPAVIWDSIKDVQSVKGTFHNDVHLYIPWTHVSMIFSMICCRAFILVETENILIKYISFAFRFYGNRSNLKAAANAVS